MGFKKRSGSNSSSRSPSTVPATVIDVEAPLSRLPSRRPSSRSSSRSSSSRDSSSNMGQLVYAPSVPLDKRTHTMTMSSGADSEHDGLEPCPVCATMLTLLSQQDAEAHVADCLESACNGGSEVKAEKPKRGRPSPPRKSSSSSSISQRKVIGTHYVVSLWKEEASTNECIICFEGFEVAERVATMNSARRVKKERKIIFVKSTMHTVISRAFARSSSSAGFQRAMGSQASFSMLARGTQSLLPVNFAPASRFNLKRWLSDDLKTKIDKAVQETDILVFMKGTKEAPQCGFSRAVVQILELQGVDFKTVNVLADEDVRSGIKEYSSWPTIPQVYVKGEFVGGCDILVNMLQSGELSKLLVEKGLMTPEAAEAANASLASDK